MTSYTAAPDINIHFGFGLQPVMSLTGLRYKGDKWSRIGRNSNQVFQKPKGTVNRAPLTRHWSLIVGQLGMCILITFFRLGKEPQGKGLIFPGNSLPHTSTSLYDFMLQLLDTDHILILPKGLKTYRISP